MERVIFMKEVILIYTSMTGNTELMAEAIVGGLDSVKVTAKDPFDVNPEDLLKYDGILIGTYTWEDGSIPDEFMFFFEELDELDLKGKQAAVFGSGDSFYNSTFGAAIHQFDNKLKELGATIVLDSLIIDLQPNEIEIQTCIDYGKKFAQLLCSNNSNKSSF